MSQPTEKKKMGAPTTYKPEYAQALVEYFTRQPYENKLAERITTRGGDVIEKYKEVPCDLPMFCGFAPTVGTWSGQLIDWRDRNPDFAQAYKFAKDQQQKILVINALRGNYEQAFSIFTSKNILDWRERNEILEVKFVFEFVTKLTYTLNSTLPAKCPHCNNLLNLRASVVKELEKISAMMQPEAKVV